jgi:nuclear mRNA export protein PCID2/THP1
LLTECGASTSLVCLGDSAFGVLILPTVLYLSRVLATIASGLGKRPDLVARLLSDRPATDDAGDRRVFNIVEDAANILRETFIKCLSDKSGSTGIGGRMTTIQGRRVGIYKAGNLCFKLLLQCRKLSSATTMFVSIDSQSPPLSNYPASERVTYLYYLGRYLFANNHFYRAQLALQSAYDQCHAQAIRHRQLILVYLIASNMCLGRFPSSKLLLRREASPLAKHFLPLCRLIASGNYLDLDSADGQWFLQKRLLFQLRNRCELLVWRSLARRVFVEVGFPGGEDNKTPFLRLSSLQAAAQWLYRQEPTSAFQRTANTGLQGGKSLSLVGDHMQQSLRDVVGSATEAIDPEFAGLEEAIAETGFDVESGTYSRRSDDLARSMIKMNGNKGPSSSLVGEDRPTMDEVESLMASLIQQDLIVGFLTHNNPRFAIPGAKSKGPLAVGFPPPWGVIRGRKGDDEDVPGWARDIQKEAVVNVFGQRPPGQFEGGGGRVVNLSGVRAVGTGSA